MTLKYVSITNNFGEQRHARLSAQVKSEHIYTPYTRMFSFVPHPTQNTLDPTLTTRPVSHNSSENLSTLSLLMMSKMDANHVKYDNSDDAATSVKDHVNKNVDTTDVFSDD